MDIIEFLNTNNITVGEENFSKVSNKKYIYDVDSQIDLIVEIQNILRGKKLDIIPRVESSIGREIESFNIQSKKLFKMIKIFEAKSSKSDFDLFIIDKGNEVLNRANKTLNYLDKREYFKIILRSMSNYDICLGRVDESNLKKENLSIFIKSTKYISYNMIEHDCYNYIKKLKKRGYKEDINKIIENFSYKSNLNKFSIDYITLLSNYPIEQMKTLLKLKVNKNKFSDEEWINKINIAKKIDGIELL